MDLGSGSLLRDPLISFGMAPLGFSVLVVVVFGVVSVVQYFCWVLWVLVSVVGWWAHCVPLLLLRV